MFEIWQSAEGNLSKDKNNNDDDEPPIIGRFFVFRMIIRQISSKFTINKKASHLRETFTGN